MTYRARCTRKKELAPRVLKNPRCSTGGTTADGREWRDEVRVVERWDRKQKRFFYSVETTGKRTWVKHLGLQPRHELSKVAL